MNRLEELAGELQTGGVRQARAIDEAEAILLAASKVDVAELIDMAWTMAYYAHRDHHDCDDHAKIAEEEFETALRLALAGREPCNECGRLRAALVELTRLDPPESVEANLRHVIYGRDARNFALGVLSASPAPTGGTND